MEYTLFNSYKDLPFNEWETLLLEDDFFLSPLCLKIIEEEHQEEITPLYIIIKDQGKVIGIDVHPELIEYSQKILDEKYPLEKPIVTFQVGSAYDFYEDHLEEYFDLINVGATALELPLNLVRLLKKGGQMVIPLKRFDGSEIFTLVEKDMNGNVIKKELMNVVYVPLVKVTG